MVNKSLVLRTIYRGAFAGKDKSDGSTINIAVKILKKMHVLGGKA